MITAVTMLMVTGTSRLDALGAPGAGGRHTLLRYDARSPTTGTLNSSQRRFKSIIGKRRFCLICDYKRDIWSLSELAKHEILAASLMAAIVTEKIEYFFFSTVSCFPTHRQPPTNCSLDCSQLTTSNSRLLPPPPPSPHPPSSFGAGNVLSHRCASERLCLHLDPLPPSPRSLLRSTPSLSHLFCSPVV